MHRLRNASRVVLAAFFILGGVNHFLSPAFYLRLMPDALPAHGFLVQLSGVTEVISGLMLLAPGTSAWGARLVAAQLLVFTWVHVFMLQHAEDRFADIPVAALWARLVVQGLLLAWALWHAELRPARAR